MSVELLDNPHHPLDPSKYAFCTKLCWYQCSVYNRNILLWKCNNIMWRKIWKNFVTDVFVNNRKSFNTAPVPKFKIRLLKFKKTVHVFFVSRLISQYTSYYLVCATLKLKFDLCTYNYVVGTIHYSSEPYRIRLESQSYYNNIIVGQLGTTRCV